MPYAELTVAVIIYPNSLDNWVDDPPFENDPLDNVDDAYIIANTQSFESGFDDDFYLLTSRFLSVGSVYNRVDFMQKTLGDSSQRNITKGIGGIAKLKDFEFKLINKIDLDVSNLYGKELEVRLYEGSTLRLSSNYYYTYFKGIIFTGETKNGVSTIRAQGTVANNNPRVKGEPYINPDGEAANSFIFIGESSNSSKVKLDKKLGVYGVQLGFDSTKYSLKNIYIKDKEVSDFYHVKNAYTVDNGLVSFDSGNSATLTDDISALQDSISVNDGIDFDFKITGDVYKQWIIVRYNSTFLYSLYKIKEYEEKGTTYGVYRASPSFMYQEYWDSMKGVVNTHMYATQNRMRFTDDDAIGDDLVSWNLKNEEAIKMPRTVTVFDDSEPIKAELVNSGESHFAKNFDVSLLPAGNKDLHVIQIDDEKMLLLYAEDVYHSGERECTVIRGYLGTTPAVHLQGSVVVVLNSEESQAPIVQIEKPLQNIYSDWQSSLNSEDYLIWSEKLNNDSSTDNTWPYTWKQSGVKSYLFLDLRLPDVQGELDSAYILSSMDWSVDDNLSTQAFMTVSLAMVEHADWREIDEVDEKVMFTRRIFGFNRNHLSHTNRKKQSDCHLQRFTTDIAADMTGTEGMGVAFLMYGQNTYTNKQTYLTYGRAKHVLKGSWHDSIDGDDLSLEYKHFSEISGKNFNFGSYDSFKDSHLSLVSRVYNNSGRYRPFNIYLYYLKLFVKLKVPVASNEWYGEVTNLSAGDGQGILIDSFSIGANGSIYVTEDEKYLFAESDTIPFICFSISDTGILNELERITDPPYDDLTTGELVLIDNEKVAKMSVSSTEFKWVETVNFEDSKFPFFFLELKQNSGVDKKIVGGSSFNFGNYVVTYDSSTISVYQKTEIADGNPVNVLKTFLVDYAKHDSSIIDDDGTSATSFHRVRVSRAKQKCTVVIEKEVNANVLVDNLCKNFGLVVYENNEGKIALADLYPPKEDQVTVTLTDADLLLDRNKKPDYSETHIDIQYLITGMDVRYSPLGDKFQEEIVSADLPSELSDKLDTAAEYTTNKTEVAFNHKSTNDRGTAIQNALVKLHYHYKPSKIINIKTRIEWAQLDICTWLNIDSNFIDGIGKIYLLLSIKDVFPMNKKLPYAQIQLFEYNYDEILGMIQEVYDEADNDGYQEVPTDTNQIQEEF